MKKKQARLKHCTCVVRRGNVLSLAKGSLYDIVREPSGTDAHVTLLINGQKVRLSTDQVEILEQ